MCFQIDKNSQKYLIRDSIRRLEAPKIIHSELKYIRKWIIQQFIHGFFHTNVHNIANFGSEYIFS